MPYYDFLNKTTGEIKSLFFGMNEDKKYIDKDGLEWERQFSVPLTAIDSVTQIDPFDHKRGIEKIKNTRGTIGDQQDFSRDQSLKREKLAGKDPVRETMFDKYKATRGKDHPEKRAEKTKELMKDIKIKLKSKLGG